MNGHQYLIKASNKEVNSTEKSDIFENLHYYGSCAFITRGKTTLHHYNTLKCQLIFMI